jgi:hypothetical protein
MNRGIHVGVEKTTEGKRKENGGKRKERKKFVLNK